MVPKSGTLVPKSRILPSESDVSHAIGKALQAELGASHRAAKTVMAWTGVSSRTARLWLHGTSSPNGRHLILLARNCQSVLIAMLLLAGHDLAVIGVELETVELQLGDMIAAVRTLRQAHT